MNYPSGHLDPAAAAVGLILFINLTPNVDGQVMEVTKTNFQELRPALEKEINEADFLSIDGEFSGLHTGSAPLSFDTPAQYYSKIRDGSMDFLFFQFGLATFKYDKSTKKYMHRAYNFYLFPRPHYKLGNKDSRFLCQSSCMDFLAKNGFDFNKVFKEGIPYLCEPQEKEAKAGIEERRQRILNAINEVIPIPDEYKECIENACQQISNLINSPDTESEIILQKRNGFSKKLLHQEINRRFANDGVVLDTKHNMLLARKGINPAQQQKEEEFKHEQELQELEEAVGFTHLIRTIARSGKLVIGHNLLLDLCHIIRQFFMPLPEDYDDFKTMLHCIFPKLLDTKYMCFAEPFKNMLQSSALVNLYTILKEHPFGIPDVGCDEEGCGYKVTVDAKHHEAGFDAFLTGITFLGLGNFLLRNENLLDKQAITETNLLTPFINKLHLMRVYDTHINLCGNDPIIDRDHVFHVSFPINWKRVHIAELFQPLGNIYVNWLNDTSAWVAVKDFPVNINLINITNFKGVTITPYEQYQELIATRENRITPYSTPTSGQMFSSPSTSAAIKKRKLEVQAASNGSGKKRKSRSLGRESFSGRSINTIPEEALEEEASPSKKGILDKTPSKVSGLGKIDKNPSKTSKKEFDENDEWE